jgi:hypothetical protein
MKSIPTVHPYRSADITGMNFMVNGGCHTLRFAGLFNLPIPIRFTFGIGVSQIKKRRNQYGRSTRILEPVMAR